jgi:uncharacterized protein (DUF305 family)
MVISSKPAPVSRQASVGYAAEWEHRCCLVGLGPKELWRLDHDEHRQTSKDMDITYSGQPDVDFVKGMIPHHQAAVDMAKTVLAFGKDPEVRKVAEEIVRSQEAEIANLQQWLKNQTQR